MKPVYKLEHTVIRFAGDSGDGIQVIGQQLAQAFALQCNDVCSLADFPAEIRAPEGSVGGVSSIQIHAGATSVYTAGDRCHLLVAMNAAALKLSLPLLVQGGTIIANIAGFSEKNLRLAGYSSNPLYDGSLQAFTVHALDISGMTISALAEYKSKLAASDIERAKNFFVLGIIYWMYHRPIEQTAEWIRKEFAAVPELVHANIEALLSGWEYAVNTELLPVRYHINPVPLPVGRYCNITGNLGIALGLMSASSKARLPLFFAGYPITPASTILQTFALWQKYGANVMQAEDEIAAISAALGAAFGGCLAATATSGPGMSLITEALGLAVMAELPLVIIDVQRSGPSTGMPTKTEQADLFQALYGRHGEAPLVVLAPASVEDCYNIVFEAARLAVKYMLPVIVLSDAYLAHSIRAWRIPEDSELPEIEVPWALRDSENTSFQPYAHNSQTLARAWAIPGMQGLEHRIGGLEKMPAGAVSYDASNHAHMVQIRAAKLERIAQDIPEVELWGDVQEAMLVISWGSTFGAVRAAVEALSKQGERIAHVHLRYLSPLPRNLYSLAAACKHSVVVELNSGQLAHVLRGVLRSSAFSITKVTGQSFTIEEIAVRLREILSLC
ncbi:MAG: 2-oxoacid:acceptor oxidoreductase subunit alpha [Bacteroidota bacterium]|nr:2-oxoacid:acceptor oxidoreductase subunit alpha [Candidatus Kapabacteria bacterium]MDW8219644.1 2-oxoacid:acceptor oxidoreductase subunit alpha [Bacteroidota bacterium]